MGMSDGRRVCLDHPRSRGVYSPTNRAAAGRNGSSPLARGLHAPAGFYDRGDADHPRSRGVYKCWRGWASRRSGSSPLARGLHFVWGFVPSPGRIIPARAGFTDGGGDCVGHGGDHPRSRGVYSRAGTVSRPGAGSSPLARGLPLAQLRQRVSYGIIPARAGFTPPAAAQAAAAWGSSPLARGLRIPVHTAKMTGRIIPARAGFTNPCTDRRERAADHPRSRGVYTHHPASTITAAGSSPLARGLRGPGPLRSMDGEDHPRSRGVYG